MGSFHIFEVFSTIMPILTAIGIGFIFGRLNIFKESFVREINYFAYSIGFPLLLFTSTISADLKTLFNFHLVAYSLGSILVIALIGYFFYGRIADQRKQGALVTTTFRSDILLFAIYIAGKLFGSDGIALAGMLTAFISPTVTTLSIVILNHLDSETKQKLDVGKLVLRIFSNPFIIAIVISVLYNLSGLPAPEIVLEPLSAIGSTTIPIVLIAIGSQLDFKKAVSSWRYIGIGVFAKLILVPVIFLPGAIALGIRGMALVCLFSQYAAPATASCHAFAEQMNSDAKLAGSVVLFSTVFSPVTIFLGLAILGSAGLI